MDLCEHKWFEEKLGEPCPWCRIDELEAENDILKRDFAERGEIIERLLAANEHTKELHAAILALIGSEGMTDAKFVQWVERALREDDKDEKTTDEN